MLTGPERQVIQEHTSTASLRTYPCFLTTSEMALAIILARRLGLPLASLVADWRDAKYHLLRDG